MPGATRAGSTRSLLSDTAVARTFALAALGRLAYGLLPLSLLFTVRDATGSFPLAATASAAFGLGALAMPVQSRLVDRHGQRRVLPAAGALFSTLLLVVAAAGTVGLPRPAVVAVAAVAGLVAPALGPAMRAQWREIAAPGPRRTTAYSLDSVVEESIYLVGPLIAGLLLARGLAPAGVLAAAALALVGVTAMTTSPFVPPVGAGSDAPPAGHATPLRHRGLRTVLLALALVGAAGAAGFVGLAGAADLRGRPELAAWGEAAIAVGAISGGLAFARWGRSEPWRRQLTILLSVLAAAYAVAAALSGSLPLVILALGLAATAMAPVFVVAFTAADAVVDEAEQTEASTWVTTGFNVGSSTGTAAGGLLLGLNPAVPFAVAGAAVAAAAVMVSLRARPPLARRRRCRPSRRS